jgi:hypothetical protein
MESRSSPNFRFALGTFGTWKQLCGAVNELGTCGLALDRMNCLGLRRVFARETTIAPFQQPLRLLGFPRNSEPIACTSGLLHERLTDAAHAGAASLMDALAKWLLPRHAGYLQDTVEAGNTSEHILRPVIPATGSLGDASRRASNAPIRDLVRSPTRLTRSRTASLSARLPGRRVKPLARWYNFQLWVGIVDADDERRACQSLLALSSDHPVCVHDLVSPRNSADAWSG